MGNEAKLATIIDLNHNGIEDYREGWFYKTLWSFAKTLVRAFAPEHTIVRRGVEAVDKAMNGGKS